MSVLAPRLYVRAVCATRRVDRPRSGAYRAVVDDQLPVVDQDDRSTLNPAPDALTADESTSLADHRDANAGRRDLAAEVRDRDAEVRDHDAEVRDGRPTEQTDAADVRRQAADDRQAAARDRAAADSDRQCARNDRKASRWDRTMARAAEADLLKALADTDDVAEATLLIGQAQGLIMAKLGETRSTR